MQDVARGSSSAANLDLEQIASQAAGMLPIDLMAISADAASSAALQAVDADLAAILSGQPPSSVEAKQSSQSEAPARSLHLTSEHYESGLQNLRQRTAVAIGAPQVRMCIAYSGSCPLCPTQLPLLLSILVSYLPCSILLLLSPVAYTLLLHL